MSPRALVVLALLVASAVVAAWVTSRAGAEPPHPSGSAAASTVVAVTPPAAVSDEVAAALRAVRAETADLRARSGRQGENALPARLLGPLTPFCYTDSFDSSFQEPPQRRTRA